MATKQVIGNCLYSGQGMCNSVEIYDDDDQLIYLMLIDFGAEKDTATVRKFTLEKLKTMITKHGKIDAMVISHSDSDHWKLMNELLKQLPDKIKIDVAAFGIGQWKKTAQSFKELVKGRLASGQKVKFIETAESDIVSADNIKAWYSEHEVTFSILAASVVTSDVVKGGSSEIEANTASIVVRVLFGGNSLIFTGDATNTTLTYMNKKLKKAVMPDICFMMTAPHHGAQATLDGTLGQLASFTGSAKPECALASAQLRVNFNHPNVCVMATMAEFAYTNAWPDSGGNHDCLLNFKDTKLCTNDKVYKKLNAGKTGDKADQWYVVSTNYNIFTTVENLSTVVDWAFHLDGDGDGRVTQGLVTATTDEFFRMIARPAVEETEFYVGRPPPGGGA
jgi:beta-lactamase superfamily II metal-dependent hydrolase